MINNFYFFLDLQGQEGYFAALGMYGIVMVREE